MRKVSLHFLVAGLILCTLSCHHRRNQDLPWAKTNLLFEDAGTGKWQEKWMLDGQRSEVINSELGMELIAGSERGNDTCHTVLWTKQSFQGNICIEYDYTRTDTTSRVVNIIYFHATGKGDAEYPGDIALWNDKRIVPHMHTYFNNMNSYHISYAAFPYSNDSANNDYIRLRRYNPEKKGLKGTDVPGDHFKTGLFKPGVPYHIQVFRHNNQIEMHIQNNQNVSEQLICKWDVSMFPPCESGRIGFRHMYTRNARYKNFKVWEIE